MKQTVSHSSLRENALQVDLGGYFGGPKYFFDGVQVKPHRGVLKVKDKSGTDLQVKIKFGMPDMFPQLVIQNETLRLVEPLRWYEYVWILLPFGLLAVGGALGGGLGVFAMLVNARIFRSQKSTFARYGLTGLITLFAFVVFLVAAMLVHGLFNKAPTSP